MENCYSYTDIEVHLPKIMEIIKDVPRTFSDYEIFSYHFMLRKLFRALLVFLEYNDGVDYVQGMNSIIGSLLIHVEESTAFWLFVDLLETYNLDDVFRQDLSGMHT
mmetsp:Transcript_37076/g.42594  ORF Transcript_37076/g.42594 Transcript_37076/m.42594 type:complete len:106 (+) Transcript_37076:334-651(+)